MWFNDSTLSSMVKVSTVAIRYMHYWHYTYFVAMQIQNIKLCERIQITDIPYPVV